MSEKMAGSQEVISWGGSLYVFSPSFFAVIGGDQ